VNLSNGIVVTGSVSPDGSLSFQLRASITDELQIRVLLEGGLFAKEKDLGRSRARERERRKAQTRSLVRRYPRKPRGWPSGRPGSIAYGPGPGALATARSSTCII
jgi:hypothetical protein